MSGGGSSEDEGIAGASLPPSTTRDDVMRQQSPGGQPLLPSPQLVNSGQQTLLAAQY